MQRNLERYGDSVIGKMFVLEEVRVFGDPDAASTRLGKAR